MLGEIYNFELRHHLRSPVFWLSAVLFFLLSFGAVTSDTVQIGGAIGNVNRNAPFVIMQILLVMSTIGVFVTTAFVANAVLRDYESRTDGILFSTPMGKWAYLTGRFGGALTAAIAIFVAVVLAIVVGSFMPWLDPERLGPFQAWPYLYSLIYLVIPNIFLMSAIFFGLATLTRSMMATYVGLVAFFVGYAVAASFLTDLENESLAAVMDPFGFGAFQLATKYWTTIERNTSVVPLEGPLLLNRLVWIGIALLVLGFTFYRFSFTTAAMRPGKLKKERKAARDDEETGHEISLTGLGAATGAGATRSFSTRAALTQLLHQTRFEVIGVVKSLPFLIILALGVLNLVGNSFFIDDLFGTPVHPRTHLLIQAIQGGFVLFAVIILTFYAGELVFRDRSKDLDEVHDALPAPNWVLWGSKLAALFAVVAGVLATAIITGVAIQAFRGYTNFELGLYFKGVGLMVGIPFLLFAVLALFFQVVSNNKYVGFLLMVLYFISLPVLDALDFDHNLYTYASSPGAPYSDMNGYGHFVEPTFWFTLYWSALAIVLLALVHVFWVRGKETGLRQRLALARQRLNVPVLATMVIGLLGFLGTGGYIFYNTNILNEYIPDDVQEDRQARYEKDYGRYEGIPQPRITAVYADVDIYPYRRAADIRGRYQLRNKTDIPIDSLHLTINPQSIDSVELGVPGAELLHLDEELGYRIYRLAQPLEPGAELGITYELAIRNPGFVNNGSNTDFVYNGTFFNSAYFPHIGYTDAFELSDPVERRRHDLPEIERMPKIDDQEARFDNYITSEADWIDFETVVSTSEDQIALAPGYLQREWTENGRRYFHYKMDAPILAFWSYLSAKWEVARDRWNDVDIAVYYHPDHPYNVQRMIEATKKSLDYFTREFSPYQHRQVRILEFPRYARFAQSFPNTIPFSESIGFIARLDDPDDLDYVFYVTAHEVAHQWWAHQVIGANVQGATVMSETMAQYSALMVMEKEYGPEKMRRFLKYELDSYLRGRGGELIEELPLYLVENQPYIHYRKGSLATYALRDYVGEEAYNRALSRYVDSVRFQQPPYTTSLEYLSFVDDAVSQDREQLLSDLFRTITLWEFRAEDASYDRLDDGRYRVRLNLEAHKYRADGQGLETEIAIDDWVDIGVFGQETDESPPEGKVLLLEKHRIDDNATTIELVVDEEPRQAGIDPFNKLIDRNPENNLTRAEAAGE